MIAPYTRILRSPTYRFIWLAQVVSNAGDTLQYVALVVLLFRLTGSGAILAVLALGQITANVALGPIAGVMVDRFDRRHLMIVSDLGRAALAVGLVFTVSVPVALMLAIAMTAAGVLFRPAAQALLPSLVDDDDLLAANTVGWSTEQVTQIVASATAGALLLTWGTAPAFLLNAASFLFSAWMLFQLPSSAGTAGSSTSPALTAFWHDAWAGVTYAVRDPFVGPLILIQALAALATGGTSALLVVLSSQHLHLPPAGFSWLLLAIGAGALVGPYLLPRRFGPDIRLIFWPYIWRGVGDGLLALFTPFPVALFLLFTYGIGTSTGAVTYSTVLQRRIPDAVRGRVFATLDVVWATGEIVSIGLAGGVVDRIGIEPIYVIGGLLLVTAGAIGLVVPGIRHPSTRGTSYV